MPITIIGDTAHLMPPFTRQGVNIRLMDALILSDNLTSRKFETIQSAIDDYEQKMFVYATDIRRRSKKTLPAGLRRFPK